MDRQATLGFILIGLVLMFWMWMQAPPPKQRPLQSQDSIVVPTEEVKSPTRETTEPPPGIPGAVASSSDRLGKFFSSRADGSEKILEVKTELFTAEISTKGGLVKKWELHEYKTWNQYPVNLVDYEKGGDFSLLFTSGDGRLINTRDLYFSSPYPRWKTVELTGNESFALELVLPIDGGGKIVKKYTFTNGKYSFDADIVFENAGSAISNYEYQVVWENGVRYAEENSVMESNEAKAYAFSGGELTEVDAANVDEIFKRDIGGAMDWVAAKTKYFAVAMLPESGKSQGAYIEGTHKLAPNKGQVESYTISLKIPYKGGYSESTKFTVFLGPLEREVIGSFNRNLEKILSLGWAWIIRPIAEYVMLPLFSFLHLFIPNFGVVIIVFAIIIKVALHPLTKSSMKSMKRMQALQPMMNEIREKHKDDPQKMNQQIMNLYKDYGVNPAGGCLPLLLQMPILYALYMVFSSAIELRQAGFVGWITDLSIPDVIVNLPFSLPLLGTSALSGVALAMGITMFIQQKMTITDPRQKAMIYVMPVMMTLLFNSFPSGLNLYYFVFNLLSIGQQMWMNKQQGDEPLKKVDRSKKQGGILGSIAKNMPKVK